MGWAPLVGWAPLAQSGVGGEFVARVRIVAKAAGPDSFAAPTPTRRGLASRIPPGSDPVGDLRALASKIPPGSDPVGAAGGWAPLAQSGIGGEFVARVRIVANAAGPDSFAAPAPTCRALASRIPPGSDPVGVRAGRRGRMGR